MDELDLFSEALLRADKAERAAFLEQACTDAGLRARVEKLLLMHESDQALPVRPPDEPTSPLAALLAPSERPGALGRLGHYDLLEKLGEGGFGVVFKAFDGSLHRVVAIKVLAPHLAETSPLRQRFLREARAAAQVKHEHVVQIYAVEERPLPHLVMEFVEGQTLQQRLDEAGPLAPAEVARLGRQVALGLAAAHAKGLIHRDVKPANILLESGVEPAAKLSDFGLARAADDASLTRSGVIAGSPMYMSPEQAAGLPLDVRSDLFSLGSVLYAMLTGRPPFRASSPLAVLKRVVEDAPRPIGQVIAGVPEGLCAVVARLMEKKADRRFASARDAAEALATCLTAPPPRRPARPKLAFVALAVAVVLAALTTWGLYQHPGFVGRDPEPLGPLAAAPIESAALVVTRAADDEEPGSLRWAVNQANLRHGEDAIVFDAAAFAKPTTIVLTQGPLVLADPAGTTITGPAAGLTLSGDGKTKVLVIGTGDEMSPQPAQARIADLTVARGRTTDDLPGGGGVLVRNGATLALTGCTLRDNAALHENQGGGAIFNVGGTVVLTNCTLASNKAGEGGGIKNYAGTVMATNCTFVGNSADTGGSMWTGGLDRARTELNNCLFAAAKGGELYLRDESSYAGDYNLTSDGTAPGPNSKPNARALFGPLGRYGGPTETVPLLTGCPALDAGDIGRVPEGVTTDQRGLPRVRKGKVDLGAFEVQ